MHETPRSAAAACEWQSSQQAVRSVQLVLTLVCDMTMGLGTCSMVGARVPQRYLNAQRPFQNWGSHSSKSQCRFNTSIGRTRQLCSAKSKEGSGNQDTHTASKSPSSGVPLVSQSMQSPESFTNGDSAPAAANIAPSQEGEELEQPSPECSSFWDVPWNFGCLLFLGIGTARTCTA